MLKGKFVSGVCLSDLTGADQCHFLPGQSLIVIMPCNYLFYAIPSNENYLIPGKPYQKILPKSTSLWIEEPTIKCNNNVKKGMDFHYYCVYLLFSPIGCPGMWDNITCWKPASVGEIVFVKCPALFRFIISEDGKVFSLCYLPLW